MLLSVTAWAQMGQMGSAQGGPGDMMGCRALWSLGFPQAPTPLTIDQAVTATQQYLILLGNPDLVAAKVIDFTNHFEVIVNEKSSGAGAFSLLIDRFSTGAVCFEPGPNMMWNTKYRMGWGHMQGPPWSWWPGVPTTQMPVTPEQAKQLAQSFLNAYLPGTTVGTDIDTFYGFYDLYVLKDGQIVGMMSVNGYTSTIWYYTWHGPFVEMKKL
ncbi:MAG: hypothetical protein A2Z21_10275 [Candidatus Fraserbacteria bacterium RBG_16_55_9]|uniref:Uncharacterized protein n=1 Tax=Fraserbacteria sp. (strain RBG_16_55_9) TaxID=1817864 RepID=A0A1F5V0V9_FRAXR|nr:MAG: hypothetical protein A2Z21_10275 [Candidatus Fraserbacteria bacterium RBG_16_55_9]